MELRHVVGVRHPREAVKALVGGQQPIAVAEVPLAEAPRGEAALAEDLGQRLLVRVEPPLIGREHHVPFHADPLGVAPGEQRRAGRRADRARHVELGEPQAVRRQPVNVRRRDRRVAEAAKVAVALVVREEEHHVRGARCDRPRPLGHQSAGANTARDEGHSGNQEGRDLAHGVLTDSWGAPWGAGVTHRTLEP